MKAWSRHYRENPVFKILTKFVYHKQVQNILFPKEERAGRGLYL